jgi:hypothetical protein
MIFDFEIQFDGAGYLLLVASQDGSLYGDTWHLSQKEAEEAAEEGYGILSDEWQRSSDAGTVLP